MGLVFTYLMTYGGSAAALFNPYVGLLIYICFAIIRPEDLWYWSVPQGNYSRIIAASLLVGWVARGRGAGRVHGAGRGPVVAEGAGVRVRRPDDPRRPDLVLPRGDARADRGDRRRLRPHPQAARPLPRPDRRGGRDAPTRRAPGHRA